MAARTTAGRFFARRAVFNAPRVRPAPREGPPPFAFRSRNSRDVPRLHSPMLRREIASLMPLHSATAKAWLVSRISEVPCESGIVSTLESETIVAKLVSEIKMPDQLSLPSPLQEKWINEHVQTTAFRAHRAL